MTRIDGDRRHTSVAYLALPIVDYPRSRRIQGYLRESSTIFAVPVPTRGGYLRRSARLFLNARAVCTDPDVVILAEFSLQYLFVAWLYARLTGALLVVDWFVGLYETNVEDWARFRGNSVRARLHAFVDQLAARLPDIVLTDTEVRAARLRQANKGRVPVHALPVGAPRWARPFSSAGASSSSSANTSETPFSARTHVRALYYGNYIPLHGLPLLVRALRELPASLDLRITLIGDGELRPSIEAAASSIDAEFLPAVAESSLFQYIAEHDIVLGVFGDSPKAATVIPNKVWQGLACGKVVVTRQSPALAEIRNLVGDRLVEASTTPRSISAAIAHATEVATRRPVELDTFSRLESYVARKYETCFRDVFSRLH